MALKGGFEPEAVAAASEAFSRSWDAVERDPVLAGQDRDSLQAELARDILDILDVTRDSERDLSRIANQAVITVRTRMLAR